MYAAKIDADSIYERNRLITMQVTFPRIVLAEYNTHRMFSRNSASSRAIPVEKMIERVMTDPFVPIYWGKNQKGMQADIELTPSEINRATTAWLRARDKAVDSAQELLDIGVHKQITNRLLEPFMWQTVICTATEWRNFFELRANRHAQPEISKVAYMMKSLVEAVIHDEYGASRPQEIGMGGWHLPLVPDYEQLVADEYSLEDIAKISCARCARVSYLTHEGVRDVSADADLYSKLKASGHMSPLEHAATPLGKDEWCGNFFGWKQLRKMIPGEAIFVGSN